ncbi:MAG TPA: sugar phosphate isomerase/epimerase [Roseimicrobium sp.]|nr:sugar phosphate isomerase/epimerase [Roseimicrobium sp.]
MSTRSESLNRRSFLRTTAVATIATAAVGSALAQSTAPSAAKRNIKLGFDNFAVRAFKWKVPQLIEYGAQLKIDSLFITDFGPFENFEDGYLSDLRKRAADQGMQIQLGSWSICPTSKTFKKDWGTAEEHLALGIRMAKALGSPVFRVILGNSGDRLTEGGIEARIDDTVRVLKSQRSKAVDAGVKIAVENHSGDMQARELVTLIEAAGKDFVGANLDSGNAAWTMEDPYESMDILGKYALTTSLRDSMIWESANGATVQWTAMGDGIIDWKTYFDRFEKLCPGVPVHIETISGFAREFAYLNKGSDLVKSFPRALARDVFRFQALAKKGHAIETFKVPAGADKAETEKSYQKEQIERSLRYCKESLGLGLRA